MLLTMLALAPAEAKNKVRHDEVVAPAWVGSPADPGVGPLSGMVAAGDVLYVAGQTGVAALGPDGAVKWKVELPPVLVRNVSVDDRGVAFTGYSVAEVDLAKGLYAWAGGGGLGDVYTYRDATVGAVSLDGTLAWQIPSDDQTALSVPGLSPDAVAVMRGITMVIYDRATGRELGRDQVPMVTLGLKAAEGMLSQAPRAKPVFKDGSFYSSYMGTIWKVDAATGTIQEKEFNAGLTSPFVDVTCGPIFVGDALAFGTTGDTNVGNAYYGLKPEKLKTDWKMASPDKISGCGAIVPSGDGGAIVASNFQVLKLNDKGKVEWESVNKKGGLYPSSYRGIRYVNSWFGVRKSWGELVVTDGSSVYVSADNSGDVVTVLDGASGAYVRTIDVKTPIVSMGVAGGKLAIATETDVRFVPL